jgi:hypothetical protein
MCCLGIVDEEKGWLRACSVLRVKCTGKAYIRSGKQLGNLPGETRLITAKARSVSTWLDIAMLPNSDS